MEIHEPATFSAGTEVKPETALPDLLGSPERKWPKPVRVALITALSALLWTPIILFFWD